MKTFHEFIVFRENKEEPKIGKGVEHKITLGPELGIEPFIVGEGERENLAVLVKAFDGSKNVEYGPKKMSQKTGKLERDKLKKKTIYLVGGAVRDYATGKTPHDYDLTTDASMDEIRLILKNAGFSEIQPQTGVSEEEETVDVAKYSGLPKTSNNPLKFWVQGTDTSGEEFVMGAKVNDETFEIATFRKDAKGTSDGRKSKAEFTNNIQDDAARRDFTINAMYMPLKIGKNNSILDYHGGMLDLKNKKVRFIGDAKERLEEDQLRAPRYARFASWFGDTDVPEEYQKAIGSISNLPALQPFTDPQGKSRDRRKRIRDEFLKGLEHSEIDPKIYVQMYNKLGLLKAVFPKLTFALDGPDDMTDEKERHLSVAWILRKNDPELVRVSLIDSHWPKKEAERIAFLIKFLKFHPNVSAEDLERYANAFTTTNFRTGYLQGQPMGPASPLKKWAAMQKMGQPWESAVDAFLKHVSHGSVKADPDDVRFADVMQRDPITGQVKGSREVGQRKAAIHHRRYQDLLRNQE
jgi:tRNA nucleotidyltransferase/poly(A) polymerase